MSHTYIYLYVTHQCLIFYACMIIVQYIVVYIINIYRERLLGQYILHLDVRKLVDVLEFILLT